MFRKVDTITHKFVALENRVQEVIGIEVTQLVTDDGIIPIVTTIQKESITLFWWSKKESKWEPKARFHSPPDILPLGSHQMEHIRDANWSLQVGLTVSNRRVFLVYHRSFEGKTGLQLYLDVFEWDSVDKELKRQNESPIQLPLDTNRIDQIGFYLWAGWDTQSNKLLLMLQRMSRITTAPIFSASPTLGTKYELVVYSADADLNISSFDTEDQWTRPLVIDDGGYDFDVLLKQGQIHCVYRREPYSLKFEGSPNREGSEWIWRIGRDSIGSPSFAPLFYRVIDPASLTIVTRESIDNIPGGDHPQIQQVRSTVEKLVITVDRLVQGAITSQNTLQLQKMTKFWLHYNEVPPDSYWSLFQVFEYDPMFYPRSLYGKWDLIDRGTDRSHLPLFICSSSRSQEFAYFSSVLRPMQVFLIGKPTIPTKKGDQLKFSLLQKTFNTEIIPSLLVERKSMSFPAQVKYKIPSGEERAIRTHWNIVDISHTQISDSNGLDNPDDNSPTGGENNQFIPLTGTINGTSNALSNTLGGCLTIFRYSEPLSLFAYSDLGDGGCRVVFKADGLNLPDPVEIGKEVRIQITAEAVGGPGIGLDQPYTLNGPTYTGWVDSHLPEYKVIQPNQNSNQLNTPIDDGNGGSINAYPGSLGSEIQIVLDTLIHYVKSSEINELSSIFDSQPPQDNVILLNNDIIDFFHTFSPHGTDETTWITNNDGNFHIEFQIPTIRWSSEQIKLDGTRSHHTTHSIISYTWRVFGPQSIIEQEGEDDNIIIGPEQDITIETNSNDPLATRPTIYLPDPVIPGTYTTELEIAISVNGNIETSTARGVFEIRELWDDLWELHSKFSRKKEYSVGNANIELGKYKISFSLDNPMLISLLGEPHIWYQSRKILIETLPEWKTQYRFLQNYLDYRFEISINSTDVHLDRILPLGVPLDLLVNVNKIDIQIYYSRPFTLGVLMKEYRDHTAEIFAITDLLMLQPTNNTTNERRLPSVLSAKPIGSTTVKINSLDVDISIDESVYVLANATAVAAILGLTIILSLLLGAGGLGIIIGAIIVGIVNIRLKPAINRWVKREIRKQFKEVFKTYVDESSLIEQAGEGLAESIAKAVLKKANIPRDPYGRDRFREQFWQMVVVEPDKCTVTVRTNQ